MEKGFFRGALLRNFLTASCTTSFLLGNPFLWHSSVHFTKILSFLKVWMGIRQLPYFNEFITPFEEKDCSWDIELSKNLSLWNIQLTASIAPLTFLLIFLNIAFIIWCLWKENYLWWWAKENIQSKYACR